MKPNNKIDLIPILFYSILATLIYFVILSLITNPGSLSIKHWDEVQYSNELQDWNKYGHEWFINNIYVNDNKPLTFFYLEKLLKHDATNLYTRALVITLAILISIIMFKMTRRYESFLFIIFPYFFGSLWLNVEIIELFLVVLSLYYTRYAGVLIGIATIFRPYAILYTCLLKKSQMIYVIVIGSVYSAYLIYLGIFSTYLNRVIYYTSMDRFEFDYLGVFVLICLAICAYNSKEIFKYGLIGMLPLVLRTWSHYILTPAGLFYFAYLYLNKKEVSNADRR